MEAARRGVKSTEDGWLNRALAASWPRAAERQRPDAAFRAVAMGTALPRILSGSYPAVAMGNVNDFGVAPRNPQAQPLANTFESMYAESVDAVLHGTAQETFDAVKMLKSADPAKYTSGRGSQLIRRAVWRCAEADGATDEGESRSAGGVYRYRRLGPSCE